MPCLQSEWVSEKQVCHLFTHFSRLGTHWIRVSNNESTNFALLPIFAFDDDYVPLSPVSTPAPRLDKPPKKPKASKHTNQNNNNNVEPLKDISVPVVPGKDLTGISETSDILSSRTSSISSSKVSETAAVTSPTVANDHLKSSKTNGRSSPEVQILDITDLDDPGVRVVSKFSFRDVDDKLHIKIYGKNERPEEKVHFYGLIADADGNQIQYQAEYLTDGRKRIFYEPAVIGETVFSLSISPTHLFL